jgi:hypothetical protein
MPDMAPFECPKIIMAADPAAVIARFQGVNARGYPRVEDMDEMRDFSPLAIVAGGPSLNRTYLDLESFKKIMVCGSAHNRLLELGIEPTWAVVSDPDPIMAQYLTRPSPRTKYLLSSACAQEVFDVLSDRDFAVWNCGDAQLDSEKWRGQGVVFGGGCTVLTRAMSIAAAFGYWDMHFFGCDTSIEKDGTHHAYEFATDGETIGEVVPLQITLDGPEYLVPAYLIGQAFDLKGMIEGLAHRIKVTVHGDGFFAAMVEEARRRAKDGK